MLRKAFLACSVIALAVDAAPSHIKRATGCGKALPEGVTRGNSTNQRIDSSSGASSRQYRIHVPETYEIDDPVPLILSFHGRKGSMAGQESVSKFSDASYGFKGIAIYPQGLPSDDGSTQWQGDPESHGVDDVLFTNELLDEILEGYCVDPDRVYINGFSNGGGVTGVLACDEKTNKRVAAFAPVSGAFYLLGGTEVPPCDPTGTTPMLNMHGFVDGTIEYQGGNNSRNNGNTSNIINWVRRWVNHNGLDVNANETEYLCQDEKKVTRYSWDDTVIHYNLSNIGHSWPAEFRDGNGATTCREADASRVILDWFSKWSL